jgi:GH18 family chitinase
MNAFTIDPAKYTHVLFGFGNITSDYAISIAGAQEQFQYFTALVGMKRIISFGGWDFLTNPDTYMIFREGVTAPNRDIFVKNVAEFVTENDLDGVDFDWEYPGAPDIPGIPPASDDDGPNYLEFLTALRAALPDKSISITAPSSYWYLKAFPIPEMVDVVDFITIMTYDLHGAWDFQGKWSEAGCPAGDCLYSHVNLTETMWALAMISKAPVATKNIVVGVSSYGRSFEMTTAGCWTSSCTWDAVGQPALCTQTSGYISNAEINQILQQNPDAQSLYSDADSTNILVYNQTQWVSYMNKANKAYRTSIYQGYNFKGIGDWAIDSEEFEPYVSDLGPGFITEELESVFAGQNLGIADIPCYSVSSSTNTSDEIESVVILGSAYIDEVLTEYAGKFAKLDPRMNRQLTLPSSLFR